MNRLKAIKVPDPMNMNHIHSMNNKHIRKHLKFSPEYEYE